MTFQVTSDKLVAVVLWKMKQQNKDSATFQEIRDYGWKLQKQCNDAGVDVLIDRYSTIDALSMCDMFYYVEINGVPYIKANSRASPQKLFDMFCICLKDFVHIVKSTSLTT